MVQPSAAKLETKPNYCEVSIFAIYTDCLRFSSSFTDSEVTTKNCVTWSSVNNSTLNESLLTIELFQIVYRNPNITLF